jgi:uncharacterized membrane protein
MDQQTNNSSQSSSNSQPNTNNSNQSSAGNNRTLFGVLSYLGPLVIVSYIASKDDPFVKFHIKQGLVLLCIEVLGWLLMSGMFMYSFWMIYKLVHLAVIVLSILGIINAVGGKEKELPLVGQFGKYFPI